jgi:hypothetical protein
MTADRGPASSAEIHRTGSSRSVGVPSLLAIGAVVAIVGSLLVWGTFSVSPSASARASGGRSRQSELGGGSQGGQQRSRPQQGNPGGERVATRDVRGTSTSVGKLLLGLACALFCLAAVALVSRTAATRRALTAIALALGVIIFVVAVITLAQPASLLGAGIERSRIVASAGTGLYLAVLGGGIALLGAGVGLFTETSVSAPAGPPTNTAWMPGR